MKNKFMKVFLLFSLALFLSFSFSSCGSSPKEREDEEPELIEQEVIEEIISIHTPIDGQWNIVAFYESGSKNKTYFKGMSSLLLEGEEVIFLYKGQEKNQKLFNKTH